MIEYFKEVNFDKVQCFGQALTIGLLIGGLGMALFFTLAGVRIPF